MKKNLINVLGILLLGLISSCGNEDVITFPDDDVSGGAIRTVTVTASIDTDASRIALGQSENGKTKVLWSKDDAIALVSGTNTYTFNRELTGELVEEVSKAYFSYAGTLPSISSEVYFCYPPVLPTDWSFQSGSVEGLSQYMTLRADLPDEAVNYDGLSLKFSHETAVVKMVLTNAELAGKTVEYACFSATDLLGTSNDKIVTTELTADEKGTVVAYIAVPATAEGATYSNVRVAFYYLGNEYFADLGERIIKKGSLITIIRDVVKEEQVQSPDFVMLPSASKFSNSLGKAIDSYTKVKFVTQSDVTSENILVTDENGVSAYWVGNGDCLELHTAAKEYLVDSSAKRMFSLSYVTAIDFGSGFNTENVTDMSYMFEGSWSLTSLDLSSFNTAKVTNMCYMFSGCSSLTSLNLSSFNTENVIDMGHMFYECSSFTSLDLGSLNTKSVLSMVNMFYGCTSLASLDISSFNTGNVKGIFGMFCNCSSLTSLDLSNFNTANVTNMNMMFRNCSSLTSLDLSNFNTANVTKMQGMFEKCTSLKNLNISSFKTDKVITMNIMFDQCSSLTSLDLGSFNTENVTDMGEMFDMCSSLTSLNLRNFNTKNVVNMSNMFSRCTSLASLNISSFNTENVTSWGGMFYDCTSLTSLDLSSFNTQNWTSADRMFYNCSSLETLNLSSFNTGNMTSMKEMFYNCSSLRSLNLSNFATDKVTVMRDMFYNCTSLTELDLRSFSFENADLENSLFGYVGTKSEIGCTVYLSYDEYNRLKDANQMENNSNCRFVWAE